MFQGTGMEKENSASGGGGGGGGGGGAEAAAVTPGATSTSEKLQADQANPLLDPTALFGDRAKVLYISRVFKITDSEEANSRGMDGQCGMIFLPATMAFVRQLMISFAFRNKSFRSSTGPVNDTFPLCFSNLTAAPGWFLFDPCNRTRYCLDNTGKYFPCN
ncbi:hypothetical protein ALC62_01432 [Cyphomyrmex costatus]|uniref:Uncharacterized protein n=1 Tax=Cyphomyrmex costatus TaxID=456900 RepID=A0A195D3Z6_9HYME|nr:hypothetical protein ALC62_01432 [Cyphomyrmex costatus]